MIQYVNKDNLVEKIKDRIRETESMQPKFDQFWAGQISAFKGVLKILDAIEVKEVESSTDAFIEKACKLLARMIWEVTYEDLEGNSVQHYDKMEFIEDFRKAMKGE